MAGVLSTTVGYTGGKTEFPTYGSVCGNDGHTEAIRVVFDPSVVSYRRLLEIWASLHNPTHRSKPQYMSAVWWNNEEQERIVRESIAQWEESMEPDPLNALAPPKPKFATVIGPAVAWWDAEERHQKWIEKNRRSR